MAMDFPNSPTNGATYTPAGGPTYVWSNGVWLQTTSLQVTTTKTARGRNRIVNPCAAVSQENGSTAMTANAYVADQWQFIVSGIVGSANGQGAATIPSPDGSPTVLVIQATTAKASLAAGDYLMLRQPVEGYDIADLNWGTAYAKPVVVRFNAYCPVAGTYGFAIVNGANNRSFSSSFTLAAATWTTVVVAVPGDTTGTWPNTNGLAAEVRFTYAFGSTFVGAAGWGGGNMAGVTGCTNGAATANQNLLVTDVGLYADPDNTGLPPKFERPSYADELARCQRYYEQVGITLSNTAAFQWLNYVSYVVWKRASPTITFVSGNAQGGTVAGGVFPSMALRQSGIATALGDVIYAASARLI